MRETYRSVGGGNWTRSSEFSSERRWVRGRRRRSWGFAEADAMRVGCGVEAAERKRSGA